MTLPIYQVDAFTSEVFSGNPAAVVPLPQWLDDVTLQHIAQENNLSETAFYVPRDSDFELRWFTPVQEVELCGHATLAAAHVLFEHAGLQRSSITFHTRSGELRVGRTDTGLTLDFPLRLLRTVDVDVAICDALGGVASEACEPDDGGWPLLYVYEFEADIATMQPDFAALQRATDKPVVVTAPGDLQDFVSRFFAPQFGINEDPVTGSAHCCLMPYWQRRLGRSALHARQVSTRGGDLLCEVKGDRVFMTGTAVTYAHGEILRY